MSAVTEPLIVPVPPRIPLWWHSTWSRAIIRPTFLIFGLLGICVLWGFAAFIAALMMP